MDDEIIEEVKSLKRRYPDCDIRIKPEPPSLWGVLMTLIYDIVLVLAVTYMVVNVSLWALLGLFFMAGASTDYEVEILNKDDSYE